MCLEKQSGLNRKRLAGRCQSQKNEKTLAAAATDSESNSRVNVIRNKQAWPAKCFGRRRCAPQPPVLDHSLAPTATVFCVCVNYIPLQNFSSIYELAHLYTNTPDGEIK